MGKLNGPISPAPAPSVSDSHALPLSAQPAMPENTFNELNQSAGNDISNANESVMPWDVLVLVPSTKMDVIIAYVSTSVVLFTLVTNCLVCIVLLKPHMRGTPTNVILVALSISTTLTGVWPLPGHIYFYVLGNYRDYVPYEWCFVYDCLVDYLPTIFHTSSIWLTVTLAVQRYLSVCHSVSAASKRLCTVPNAVRASVAVLIAAALAHCVRFFERNYSADVVESLLYRGQNVSACLWQFSAFVAKYEHQYFSAYYVFRVVFINVIPCIILVLMNAALVHTMKTAETRRKVLLKYNHRTECRRLAESNSTTMMLVAVVGVFLLVEFPMAVIFVMLIVNNILELDVFDERSSWMASNIVNVLILFSYLINFFIYCGMSRQFRETFKSLFGYQAPMSRQDSRNAEETENHRRRKCTNVTNL